VQCYERRSTAMHQDTQPFTHAVTASLSQAGTNSAHLICHADASSTQLKALPEAVPPLLASTTCHAAHLEVVQALCEGCVRPCAGGEQVAQRVLPAATRCTNVVEIRREGFLLGLRQRLACVCGGGAVGKQAGGSCKGCSRDRRGEGTRVRHMSRVCSTPRGVPGTPRSSPWCWKRPLT
jgi:hypothetical protein